MEENLHRPCGGCGVVCGRFGAGRNGAESRAGRARGRSGKTAPNTTWPSPSRRNRTPIPALSLLDQWKQKYPNSDYEMMRLKFYLVTYQKLKNAAKMMETSKAILAKDPNDMQALYWSTLLPSA